MGVIYKATNKINGKSYIGQTNDFSRRKREHLNCHGAPCAFHYAIIKYGKDAFEWSILEENISDKDIDAREKYWIKQYNSYKKGYNGTIGGQNGGRNPLDKWRKENPEKFKEIYSANLEQAHKWWRDRPEEHLEQILRIQKNAMKVVCKKVKCIELDLVFDSLTDAERWSKSDKNPNGKTAMHQHISKVCKKQRHTTGGYHWEYVE